MRLADAKLGMKVRVPGIHIDGDYLPEQWGEIVGIDERSGTIMVATDDTDLDPDDGLIEVLPDALEPA